MRGDDLHTALSLNDAGVLERDTQGPGLKEKVMSFWLDELASASEILIVLEGEVRGVITWDGGRYLTWFRLDEEDERYLVEVERSHLGRIGILKRSLSSEQGSVDKELRYVGKGGMTFREYVISEMESWSKRIISAHGNTAHLHPHPIHGFVKW